MTEQIKTWTKIGNENLWIRESWDPPFNESSFAACDTIEDLAYQLGPEHCWCLGTAFYFLFLRWTRSPRGKPVWDRFVLRIWMIGPLVRMVAVGRFSRILGTLLAGGVPLLKALEIVKFLLGNDVLIKVVEEATAAIREGESIAAPLAKSGQFPPMVTRMIAVGERSGHLEDMLENVAMAYETETDMRITRLTTLMEPLMILTMGVIVAFVVFSMLMPILQMNEMIGG